VGSPTTSKEKRVTLDRRREGSEWNYVLEKRKIIYLKGKEH